jgi:AcrR family transcriptional regulator
MLPIVIFSGGGDPKGAEVVESTARRRLPPDERRELIVQSAAKLFATLPYSQVSTIDLAREAGITRGLLNHYFTDKRGLYLEVVRRAVLLPTLEQLPETVPGTLHQRVDAAVDWFLDSVEPSAETYLSVMETEGNAADIAPILRHADDVAARRVLTLIGLDDSDETILAMVRSYGGLAKATVYEWLRRETLTREQAHALLRDVLLFMAANVLSADGVPSST